MIVASKYEEQKLWCVFLLDNNHKWLYLSYLVAKPDVDALIKTLLLFLVFADWLGPHFCEWWLLNRYCTMTVAGLVVLALSLYRDMAKLVTMGSVGGASGAGSLAIQ